MNPVSDSQPDSKIANNMSAPESRDLPPSLWGWHTILSLAITIAIFAFLASKLDLARVWHEVSQSNVTLLILGALAHYATYPLRGARWQRCMTHLPARCGQGKFGLLLFFYNAVDNVVPAKLGDVYGAHLARINCGIRRSAAMGSLVFLRMVDAWIVLALALPASWLLFSAKLPKAVFWALIGGVIIAVAVTAIILIFFFLKKSLPGWLPDKIKDIVRAFQTGMWPRPNEAIPIAALTIAIWVLETLWIFLLVLGFGVTLNGKEVCLFNHDPAPGIRVPADAVRRRGRGYYALQLPASGRCALAPGRIHYGRQSLHRLLASYRIGAIGVGAAREAGYPCVA